ncbi:MAG: hypothetical protein JW894_10355 [Bacteroidales bacterium]|nr:hypothetical protein [Bacteroidales bacterium]
MSDRIEHAEKIWKERVWAYITELFKGNWLPSHDPGHHYRVWKNACLVSRDLLNNNPVSDEYFFEKLFIACFFHDTGLLIDKGEKHGKYSRDICRKFLNKNMDLVKFDTAKMLSAIELHDDKEYISVSNFRNDLLYSILALSDDMDAFGAMGVYRYIEIYLKRNIDIRQMPQRILQNASQRFDHLSGTAAETELDIKAIRVMFKRLITLVTEASFSEKPETLIEWINKEIILPQCYPEEIIVQYGNHKPENSRISLFIDLYREEASTFI